MPVAIDKLPAFTGDTTFTPLLLVCRYATIRRWRRQRYMVRRADTRHDYIAMPRFHCCHITYFAITPPLFAYGACRADMRRVISRHALPFSWLIPLFAIR